MFIVLLILLFGTLAYLWWRWQTTTLTRKCRWRQDRRRGGWHCIYCDAWIEGQLHREPRRCLRIRQSA